MNTPIIQLLLPLLLALLPVSLQAQVQAGLTDAEGSPGEEVEVRVSLSNSQPLSGLQLLFDVPSASGLSLPAATATGRASAFSASSGIRNGRASVMLYSAGGQRLAAGEGEVLCFKLKLGKNPLDLSLPVEVRATDASGQPLQAAAATFHVACLQARAVYHTTTLDFGRVPLDQQPVQQLQVSNEGTAPLHISGLCFEGAGFSSPTSMPLTIGPGQSQAIEVRFTPTERGSVSGTLILDCNSPQTYNRIALQAQPYAVNEIHVGNASGASDSEVTIDLSMNNMDPITGFTLEFDLPDELAYVDGSFTLSNRSQGHQLQVNQVGNRLKANAYSLQNKAFTGHQGTLASFKVRLQGKSGVTLTPVKTVLAAFYKGQVQNVHSASYGGSIQIYYPSLSVSSSLELGRTPVTQTARVSLPVSNYGSAPLIIDRVVSTNEHLCPVTPLPLTLQPYQQTEINFELSTRTEGRVDGLLQVYSNDPDSRLTQVSFSGERYAPNDLAFSAVDTPQNSGSLPVAVSLSNYDAISGFQFDVHYPAGLKVSDEIRLSDRAQGFSLSHRSVGKNVERYFIYSLKGHSISSGQGHVFDLLFDLPANMPLGQHIFSVTDIKLSTPGLSEKHSQSGVSFALQILSPFYPVTSVRVEPATLQVRLDETPQLRATVSPDSASNKVLEWTTSDPQVATVDAQGVIHPLKLGKVVLTATTTDGTNLSARCEAEVVAPLAQSVNLDPSSLSLYVGQTDRLSATVVPAQALQQVTFTSSRPDIVAVNDRGEVTARALGEAVLTATTTDGSNRTAQCKVQVVPTPAAQVTLNKESVTLKATETFQLEATVSPASTTDKTIRWSSTNEEVAKVDASGKVTALSVGNATITATCGEASAQCEVSVVSTPAAQVTLNKQSATLKATETVQLEATVSPESTTDKTIHWSSSNEEVAKVDAQGLVTALSVGQATITATCGEASAQCEVSVVPVLPAGIQLDPEQLDLNLYETFQLVATVSPANVTDASVVWSSSRPDVVQVDDQGLVTALSVGQATITATDTEGHSATCEVKVSDDLSIEVLESLPAGKVLIFNLKGILQTAKFKDLPRGWYIVNGRKVRKP